MSQRAEASNEESYLISGRPSSLLKASFSSGKLEQLYRASSLQQRRDGLQCFLASALLYDAYTGGLPGAELGVRAACGACFAINLALLGFAERGARSHGRGALWSLLPHVAWILALGQLLAPLYLKSGEVTPRDNLGWLLLLLYLHFATLPLRFSVCALLATGTAALYVLSVYALTHLEMPIEVLVSAAVSYLLDCVLPFSAPFQHLCT